MNLNLSLKHFCCGCELGARSLLRVARRFVPRESGAHLIHVLQHDPSDATSATERHVPGSPFRIVVGGRYELADPSLVHAVGEGLVRGQVWPSSSFLKIHLLHN